MFGTVSMLKGQRGFPMVGILYIVFPVFCDPLKNVRNHKALLPLIVLFFFFLGGVKSGFEMCFFSCDPSTFGAGGPHQNTSRTQALKQKEVLLKPYFVYFVYIVYFVTGHICSKTVYQNERVVASDKVRQSHIVNQNAWQAPSGFEMCLAIRTPKTRALSSVRPRHVPCHVEGKAEV